jgi:hypothetical protein
MAESDVNYQKNQRLMAEIHVQRKRRSLWWLWLLIILIVAAIVYYLYKNNYFNTETLNVMSISPMELFPVIGTYLS